MDERVAEVVAEYDKRYREESVLIESLSPDELRDRRDDFLIPVGHEVGRFLHDLATAAKAKLIIEFGTSYGYSALWLALAARATGGRLISLDVAADKQAFARDQLERAGLASYVEFKLGDARETAAALDGPFDLVLIDLWKDLYVPCFDAVRPKLASPAFVIADNMIYPPQSHSDAERYRTHIASRVTQSVLLPLGNGIEVSRVEH